MSSMKYKDKKTNPTVTLLEMVDSMRQKTWKIRKKNAGR